MINVTAVRLYDTAIEPIKNKHGSKVGFVTRYSVPTFESLAQGEDGESNC